MRDRGPLQDLLISHNVEHSWLIGQLTVLLASKLEFVGTSLSFLLFLLFGNVLGKVSECGLTTSLVGEGTPVFEHAVTGGI